MIFLPQASLTRMQVDLMGLMYYLNRLQFSFSMSSPSAWLASIKYWISVLGNASMSVSALAWLKKLSSIVSYSDCALDLMSKSARASQALWSTLVSLQAFFFHQLQQTKRKGNTKTVPRRKVLYTQQVLGVFIYVPLRRMRRVLIFITSSSLRPVTNFLNDDPVPLKTKTESSVGFSSSISGRSVELSMLSEAKLYELASILGCYVYVMVLLNIPTTNIIGPRGPILFYFFAPPVKPISLQAVEWAVEKPSSRFDFISIRKPLVFDQPKPFLSTGAVASLNDTQQHGQKWFISLQAQIDEVGWRQKQKKEHEQESVDQPGMQAAPEGHLAFLSLRKDMMVFFLCSGAGCWCLGFTGSQWFWGRTRWSSSPKLSLNLRGLTIGLRGQADSSAAVANAHMDIVLYYECLQILLLKCQNQPPVSGLFEPVSLPQLSLLLGLAQCPKTLAIFLFAQG